MLKAQLGFAAVATAAAMVAGAAVAQMPSLAQSPPVTDDGTITTPSFDLPYSSYASPQARDAFVRRLRNPLPIVPNIAKMRQITDQSMASFLSQEEALFPHSAAKSIIGGVPVEIIIPTSGVAPKNQNRVLINVHGGAFVAGGGGPGGEAESIPIAYVGRIKVVAVDYRLGPENHFPAASEDLAAVYGDLLKTYRPENIGIYGCSAGGMLTGEAIPWFLKARLPLPGAIGIFCASTHPSGAGDSAQLWQRMGSVIRIVPPAKPNPDSFGPDAMYFAGTSPHDPLAVPSASKDVLKAFPPTLFLTGTRAPDMSGAVESHLELVELGVKSQLLLFDGMDHGFFSDPSLPESQRAYALITQFFAENLGVKRPLSAAANRQIP